MPEFQVVKLSRHDIPIIHKLEQACWPPEMQATPDTLSRRFDLGHIMLGAIMDDQLVGLIAYRLDWFDPENLRLFPKTFDEFASGESQPSFNAVFGYNMSVQPKARGSLVIYRLLKGAIEIVREAGCRYIVADGRCPSYNGGTTGSKLIRQSPVFRQAVDRYLGGGAYPSLQEFLADPTLRFFYRTMHCRFLDIRPNFYPGDKASGGHRVIYCADLS